MRMLGGIIATLSIVFGLSVSPSVSALDAVPPPVEYFSPLYITAFQQGQVSYQIGGINIPTDSLDIIELHNDTSDPIDLSGWSVKASDQYGLICTISLSSWILPDDFVVLARTGLGLTDSSGNIRSFGDCRQQDRTITGITLERNGNIEEQIIATTPGAFARKGLTKTYRTSVFTKDFVVMNSASRTSLYAGVWYDSLPATSLRVVEVMARARACSPLEQAGDCHDFIKLYNPTASDVVLDGLRLRVGYQGQSVSTSNAHPLTGVIPAGHYGVLTQESDGSPLSVTNDGGWVWLEDTYGIKRYDDTVAAYPSASSDTKIGWSWAQDQADALWKWTTSPKPYDGPSVFTLPIEESSTIVPSSTLQTCASNQYRNPLTNRCKLIGSTASSLQSCAANQYRNTATNRCRNVSSSSSSVQTACASNQYRNPATNRCKAIASTASSLKPCTKNQERNAETNRCRNKTIVTQSDFPVQAVAQTGQATIGWWAFGGVGLLALGYAGWEWRTEIGIAIRKVPAFFVSSK